MARVSVRVNYEAIQGLFTYGDIARFGQRTSQRARGLARIAAPKRTGRLANSITANPAAGTLTYTISVGSRLDYANWVNHGTTGPITAKHGLWLSVGKREGKHHGRGYAKRSVRGQRAQRFLEQGAQAALAAEGIFIRL
jgi:hypothetical protein